MYVTLVQAKIYQVETQAMMTLNVTRKNEGDIMLISPTNKVLTIRREKNTDPKLLLLFQVGHQRPSPVL